MSIIISLCLFFSIITGAIFLFTSTSDSNGSELETQIDLEQDGTVAFTNVSVIPMNKEIVLTNRTVLISNGKIIDIRESGRFELPSKTRNIDASGKFLMPGISDMHVHIRNKSELISYLAHGVTTVLNMRGTPQILQLQKEVSAGKTLGPTIYTTGPLVDGDPPIWSGSGTVVVTNAADARRVVSEQKRQGYNFIKVYNRLSPEAYAAVMDAAEQNELAVVGHIPREVGAEHVLEKRQAMIAHSEELFFTYFGAPRDQIDQQAQQYQLDHDKIPLIAEKTLKAGTALTPNLSFVAMTKEQLQDLNSILSDPEIEYLSEDVLEMWKSSNPTKRRDLETFVARERIKYPLVRELTRHFANAGVLLLLGTDSSAPGMFPGKSAHLELQELVDAGISPYGALATGTRNAGAFIKRYVKNSEQFGTVAIGQRADLVLLNKNPLENIVASRDIAGVMLRGHWFSADALKKMRKAKPE